MAQRIALNQRQVYDTDEFMDRVYDMAWRYDNWTYPFYGSQLTLQKEAVLTTVEDAQRYVDILLVRPEVRALREGPVPRIEVKQSKYRDAGHAQTMSSTIHITKGPNPVFRERHVLHELAHCLSSVSGHGEHYRRIYIQLIEYAAGPEAAMIYRAKLHEFTQDRERYIKYS